MDDQFEGQYEAFQDLLNSSTPERALRQFKVLGVHPDVIDRIRARHEAEAIAVRDRGIAPMVVRNNRTTWYTGPREGDKHWESLVARLAAGGWSEESIDALDRSSSQVMEQLNHPKEAAFSSRGLVLGHVQSGKTTNFTAVMAKAADSGYKLFIVLAGIHNSLRRQTQVRLMKDLIEANEPSWMQLTIADNDFTPPTSSAVSYFAQTNRQHVLCVIKKNAPVLRKFRDWLGSASEYMAEVPTLIIDDEADQATVASPTLNPLILEIMGNLPKAAYIGYTATPFANLLIDPASDDLYPSDFIISLPKPTGHFGTEVLFGRDLLDDEDPEDLDIGYDMIRTIDDDEVDLVRPRTKADREFFVPEITGELRKAILYFWMATAARRVRRVGNKHSTMLIHTSVNTEVHNSFREPLDAFRRNILRGIDSSGSVVDELRQLWQKEAAAVPAIEFNHKTVPFDEVLRLLPGVLDDCRIILDNATSKVRLDYEGDPVVAIAVGGNTLSRGLTLEGLVVSYFVRSVSAYDTLLQMGRWFGYRIGYEDLPRVWMTSDLQTWFRHLATVESEIRRDIDMYMTGDVTPMTFAVRIRTHPSLGVTSAAKMTNAVTASAAYGGHRVQTHVFDVDRAVLERNQNAARNLLTRLIDEGYSLKHDEKEDRYVIYGVPRGEILDFLKDYSFFDDERERRVGDKNLRTLLSEYIDKRGKVGSLRTWNVAVIGRRAKGRPIDASERFALAPGIAPARVTRSRLPGDLHDIKTLMSRADAAVDLDVTNQKLPLTEPAIQKLRTDQAPDRGLLTIYVIDKDSTPPRTSRGEKGRQPMNAPEHVIGIGIVFPNVSNDDSTVENSYVSAALPELEEDDTTALDNEDLGDSVGA
ncbi:Z1 domain-containing protein [Tsukamurella paurometabola]|uniref:Z1 domain-containing protein n=1 Tax=Tsukamurella paurometabola TaxID=2061 RepID=A0ABS5NI06_TSUPA|nr:Z1 domain-containing protein [Tsukamurella paurometabola]MBS4103919.1 Z1 domain-containing protein [Tsukamurella paurometabola]